MTSLNTCQVCSPAEDFQSSQGRCHLAHKARKRERTLTWRVGIWNVHSVVDRWISGGQMDQWWTDGSVVDRWISGGQMDQWWTDGSVVDRWISGSS